MPIRSTGHETDLGVDLTPIIDMVFLLLIFFLVATTFHQSERELSIALPATSSAAPLSQSVRELVINVTGSGEWVVSGRAVSPEELRRLVAGAVAKNPEQKVTVRGDRSVAYEQVVRVLDACKAAGVQRPYLDTVLGR